MNTVLLSDWLDVIENRITAADQYDWGCYGENSFSITFWNQRHGVDERSTTVVYDIVTQEIYEAIVYTTKDGVEHPKCYRWFAPNYSKAYFDECALRGIDDDEYFKYTDLELWEDFADKCHAIVNDYEYDTRVSIPLNFSNEDLLELFKLAHEKDMTFNDFIETGLKQTLDQTLINLNENYDNAWPMSINDNR